MKTTFKKSVLAFLTCVLALAFALTGCSGGGKDPKANFVGSWQYSGGTLDGEELTDEYMDMLKEWGLNCILILDEDGTGVLDMFLEVADLKWEAKDATTVPITAEDESHDLKLKDDKLVLEVEGDKLIFTKSDKDLSGTVKKDRENAEKEEEIDEAVEDGDVQSVEISPAVTVADDDLCTITITEKFKDDWGDIGFVVNITNKSDKDLTFYAPTGKTNVNGTMKEAWFSAHLMPGTNATEEFTFSKGTLDSFDSLAEHLKAQDILFCMGNSDVPVGQYTQKILAYYDLDEAALAAAGVITYGSNVKEVTTQVSEASVDAGVVYCTDAYSAGLTPVDEATKEMCGQVIYPAAVMKNALHAEATKEFLAYLRTDKAATVFESVGFTAL